MRRILYCIFALVMAIGATGTELRLPQVVDTDCSISGDEACPCGMDMSRRGPQGPQQGAQCNTSVPSPATLPPRKLRTILEYATSADVTTSEPKPWPPSWTLLAQTKSLESRAPEATQVNTGPPLLASERSARLRVFRI